MSCCHYYEPTETGDPCFAIESASVTFGRGALLSAGDHARALGCRRVAVFTDRVVGALGPVEQVLGALRQAGADAVVYDEVRVEPSDGSFLAAARFVAEGRFDGFVSVGGGSVMDTCKAALLYATHPADFLTYVNQPVGAGAPVPGPLPPHIACPTTCGTGSECTGIAVCELAGSRVKVGISQKPLRPTLALVDPTCARTLPANVVAASGFDVLSHALESYTARPYTRRPRPARAALRPMSQGANPFSDLGSLEALRLCGLYLLRAVRDAGDHEAREQLMYAAMLAGMAFGNAGVHVPHGMAYSAAGLMGDRDFRLPGYPQEHPLLPHGVSVILSAPAVFRFTAAACPERHLAGAQVLGADTRGAALADAGEVLAARLIELMRAAGMPDGFAGVGYHPGDVGALAEGAVVQTRLLQNAPRDVDREALAGLFRGALTYWGPGR